MSNLEMPDDPGSSSVERDPGLRQLARELDGTKSHLGDIVAQYERSIEELKASNADLVAVNKELKSKVDELGDANSDLHNLMASTAIATVFLDRELRVMRYTPSAVAIFRLVPSDAGREIADLARRVDYPELQEDAQRVLATLVPADREVRNSEGRWFISRILPYRTIDDRIGGVVLTFVDITERKQADEAMRGSEARLAAIFSQVAVGLCELSQDGRFERVNPELCRLLGRDETELLKLNVVEVSHPDDLVACSAAVKRVVEGGCTESMEKRFVRPDGTIVWANSTVTKLDGDAEQKARLLAVTVDLTARRKAEAALAESEERMRLIIENAREYAICTLDFDRKITTWNVGAERLLGWTEAEMIGQAADLIFTPEDRAQGIPERELEEALQHGRAADERWHARKDGTRFWGNGAMMSMHDAAGKVVGLVKIFRDETAVRNATEALEKSRQELWEALQDNKRARAEVEAAAAAKDHFLAVLSHELRTPLTPVLVTAHALRKRKDLPPDVINAAELIRRNVQLEAYFIDDLLDVTRISRGKLEIAREPVDFHEVARHAIEIAQPDLTEKSHQLTVSLDAKETRVIGDNSRLQQVMWNVLKNAAKFTPIGGAISVSTRNEPGTVVFEVEDNGVGIEADAMVRIFDAFAQESQSVTREFGGLGLGLAIAKATALAHGGTLAAASGGKGKGATFTLTLPIAKE